MKRAIEEIVQANVTRISPKLRLFSDLIKAIESHIEKEGLREAVPCLLEALEYPEYLKKKFPDQYIDKVDNIQELQAGILDFLHQDPEANLSSWLESVTLIRDKDEDESGPTISLMTLHMAKGLEFPRVYICGFEEGLIPHKNSSDDTGQLEEERRLLYVGITRAKKKLTLLGAERRRTYNNININAPSRFSYEIPTSVLSMNPKTKEIIFGSNTEQDTPKSDYDDSYSYETYDDGSESFVGKAVYHPTYGKGILVSTEESFGVSKVVVDFTDFGLRKIRASQLKLI